MRIGPLLIKIVCVRKHFRISHQATNLVVFLGAGICPLLSTPGICQSRGLGAAGI